MKRMLITVLLAIVLVGCASTAEHQQAMAEQYQRANQAILDYQAGKITKEQAVQVIQDAATKYNVAQGKYNDASQWNSFLAAWAAQDHSYYGPTTNAYAPKSDFGWKHYNTSNGTYDVFSDGMGNYDIMSPTGR